MEENTIGNDRARLERWETDTVGRGSDDGKRYDRMEKDTIGTTGRGSNDGEKIRSGTTGRGTTGCGSNARTMRKRFDREQPGAARTMGKRYDQKRPLERWKKDTIWNDRARLER